MLGIEDFAVERACLPWNAKSSDDLYASNYYRIQSVMRQRTRAAGNRHGGRRGAAVSSILNAPILSTVLQYADE